jgi:hypothetical protein
MAYQRKSLGDKGINVFGAISVGGGGALSGLKRGTIASSTAAIGQFATLTTERTVSGAVVGDVAIIYGSSSLNAGLTIEAIAPCYATSTINVTFLNHSSASVTGTSELSHPYILVKLST